MNITVIGCGYVGLVTATGLAEFGHQVVAVDKDVNKIEMLNNGKIPIYENGLDDLVKRNTDAGRLSFTENLETGIRDALAIFITVGTPSQENGDVDLSQVVAVAEEIGRMLCEYKLVINKSTVPVGTGKLVHQTIAAHLKHPVEFEVASNPEFLREGTAVVDFMEPDRVVIGTSSSRAERLMKEIYQELLSKNVPFIFTNVETAELIKYASNAFLATKISFINEMAGLCELSNADVMTLAQGMGLDKRIGLSFLNAGPGYGGSCFPKDTRGLIEIARKCGGKVSIVETVVSANEAQKERMFDKIRHVVGDLNGKTIAVLGLSFKSDTDDMRESPAIPIIRHLLDSGAIIQAYDPAAVSEAQKIFGDTVHYCGTALEAVTHADAVAIMTEWQEFKDLDLNHIRKLVKQPVLIDLRNIYQPEEVKNIGFLYEGIGRGIKH